MSKTKILELIRKVLNKSQNNPSEEEAATALLMAQRLALKHGVDMSEVEDFAPGGQGELMQVEMDPTGNMPQWHLFLAVTIADNFRVKVWRRASIDKSLRKSCIVFFGEACDVAIASEIYKHALKIIPAMASVYIDRMYDQLLDSVKAFCKGMTKEAALRTACGPRFSQAQGVKVSYCRGFVAGMNEKFKSQVKSCGMELMVLPSARVTEAFEERQKQMKKQPIKTKRMMGECYHAGHRDGKNYELNNKLIGG